MSDPFSSDWFPDAEANPMRAAQTGMRASLPKRFYDKAGVEERGGLFQLVLDGRPANTPGRRPLAVPSRGLAEAIAAEWDGQGAMIDPAAMPVTRIVNSALDGVAGREKEVREDLVRYAGSDLTCYRAGDPDRLVAAQNAAWNPVLAWARDSLGARFALAEGLMHVEQPEEATAAVGRALAAVTSPLKLAALHVMTTLTGSVLLALAHAAGTLSADEAFEAAHVDERHQERVWGEDAEAMERRAVRRADFDAASRVYALA
jgi:chaperone required for assembly of F1-ATPase